MPIGFIGGRSVECLSVDDRSVYRDWLKCQKCRCGHTLFEHEYGNSILGCKRNCKHCDCKDFDKVE